MFASGARVTLGEVARWNAAARATTVLVRHPDQEQATYRRRPDESPAAFAGRFTRLCSHPGCHERNHLD
jgi:hypothetical protein